MTGSKIYVSVCLTSLRGGGKDQKIPKVYNQLQAPTFYWTEYF